jgi:hypothetical protein
VLAGLQGTGPAYRQPAAAKVWVFSILRSVFLRQAEQGRSQGAVISRQDFDASRLTRGEALHDAYESLLPMRQALRQETWQAMLKLPVPYREAVILAHMDRRLEARPGIGARRRREASFGARPEPLPVLTTKVSHLLQAIELCDQVRD